MLQAHRKAIAEVERINLTRAIEQAAEAIVITDAAGAIQYVNPAFTAMTGYEVREAIGQNTRLLRSGLQPSTYYQHLWQTVLGGSVWRGELTNRRKDGSLYTEEMTIAPVRDADGQTVSFIAIKQDVTRRRAAEQAQRFLASIVEFTEEAIIGGSPDGAIQTWNRAAETLYGYSAEEILGHNCLRLTPHEHHQELLTVLERISRGEAVRQVEMTGLRKDGRRFDASVSASAIRDPSGQITALAAIVRDITEQKQAERALRASEERYRALFENMQVGVAQCRMLFRDGHPFDFEYINVNRAFEQLTGLRNLCGKSCSQLMPGITATPEWLAPYARVVHSGQPEKFELFLADLRKWFSISAHRAGPGEFVAVFDNVTQGKEAHLAAEERAHLAMLGAQVGMALTTCSSMRPGLQRCAEAFVRHMGAAFARIWVLNEKTNILELEASAGMYTHLDGPHGRIPVGAYKIGWIAEHRLPQLSHNAQFDERIGDREWARREGLVGFAGYPLVVEGATVGVIAAFRRSPFGESALDTFDSVSVQLAQFIVRKKAEERTRASLAEKEALLREIHHRVKNNLQVVCSLLKLNSRNLNDPHARNVFDDMQNRVKSMALVHETLYRSGDLAGIDFTGYIPQLVDHLLRAYGISTGRVRLHFDVECAVLPIDMAIPCGLVLTELVSNAAKHALCTTHGGWLRVTFRGDAALWRMIVEDSGAAPQSTPQPGTSFGLEIVRLLTEQLGGHVQFERTPGYCVRVSFPQGGKP